MLEEFIKKYQYNLDESLIRKHPLQTRHDSKLFLYDSKRNVVTHDYFYNLDKYLPENSKLILNQTKVLPAKLPCVGKMGGKYDLFLVLNEWNGVGDVTVFTDRPISKVKPRKVFLKGNKNIEITLYKGPDGITYLNSGENNIFDILNKYGQTPIPHYLSWKEGSLKEEYLRERYQTVFARDGKSVAAPTASLHFTKEVFDKLKEKNITSEYISLEIGRGTFSNLKQENLTDGKLHKEKYFISDACAETLKDKSIKKVVVGTTACRTIESFGRTKEQEGETDIFIRDDFDFKYTDILITNFHLPGTSLMALVDSYLQHKGARMNIIDLYNIAKENNYAFYSFGDAMIIL